jgi:hypothetical protein
MIELKQYADTKEGTYEIFRDSNTIPPSWVTKNSGSAAATEGKNCFSLPPAIEDYYLQMHYVKDMVTSSLWYSFV